MMAIETRGLTKRFGGRTAVDSLDLQIEQGECFALLGQNGAGKTTTIRMLCCLTPPTAGDAVLLGDSILADPEKVKQKLNVSPQETAVATKLCVRENLELIARIYGFDKKSAQKKATELLEQFHLTNRARDKAKALSGGQQRRLSIAMALISEPSILFLDEPTVGMDVRARRDLWRLLSELKGKVTIILTTHYLEEAEALADRIAIMNQGQLKVLGTVTEICSSLSVDTLEDAFLAVTDEFVD